MNKLGLGFRMLVFPLSFQGVKRCFVLWDPGFCFDRRLLLHVPQFHPKPKPNPRLLCCILVRIALDPKSPRPNTLGMIFKVPLKVLRGQHIGTGPPHADPFEEGPKPLKLKTPTAQTPKLWSLL